MKQTATTMTRWKVSPRPIGHPHKALGQHFLIDHSIVQRIIEAGDLGPGDTVVEVGPGRGVLTGELVKRVQQVIAVELDPELASSLPGRLGHPPNLTVVNADARTYDFHQVAPGEGSWKVMANLPYYAANPITRRFLEEEPRPRLMVVMVQQEVARNMVASPGRMGLLSVAVQFYGKPQMVCPVPATAFRPPPKVKSAVVRIDLRPSPAIATDDEAEFFRLVKAGFSAPRKQLHNALSRGLGVSVDQAADLLERAGLDSTRRPGTLGLEEWGRLHRARMEA